MILLILTLICLIELWVHCILTAHAGHFILVSPSRFLDFIYFHEDCHHLGINLLLRKKYGRVVPKEIL